jgi:alanyl-tRNA synthetase
MAGNFSFGDYFKEGAISLAWQLVTSAASDGGFGLDPDRIWVTVYQDDDEAIGLWKRIAELPEHRIQRRGMEDNFWSMGVPGPCGPCSEIYYDRGADYGPEGGPEVDEERYLEFWNLVFMQYERGAGGVKKDFPILGDLPAQNIDTGLGLERLSVLLQGVDNVYETDLLRPVIVTAEQLTGVRYGGDSRADVRLRIIADHTRTAAFLVADGVVPSNEGRGYVLRRLLRRVVRNMRLLGYDGPAMRELVSVVRDAMGASYPELVSDFARIEAVVRTEEESFRNTLHTGTVHFDKALQQSRSSGVLSGEHAFTLHDTYGFPLELTLEMASEAGLRVDEAGFKRLMDEQRQRAKQDAAARKTGHRDVSAYRDLLDRAGASVFTGYDEVATQAKVVGVLAGDGDGELEVILDRTPFYAEAGGQLADEGVIHLDGGVQLRVYDVQKPAGDLIGHRVRVIDGGVEPGATVLAEVDVGRRRSISRSHTATHLVHQAIRRALGETAAQAGSENAPGRLRFDFTSTGAVPPSVLRDVEEEVNAILLDDLPVRAFVTTQEEARRIGAIALFGEKYGDAVRVVEVGDYARELCGGTHVARSGQLGVVKLLGESSIGSGVRRINGLVGLDAFRHLAREHVLLAQLADAFRARPEELPERVAATVERLRSAEKELERLRAAAVLAGAASLAAAAEDVHGVALVTHQAPEGTSADDLRRLALDVRGRIDTTRPAVVATTGAADGKAMVVVAVNDAGRGRGLRAGEIVRFVAERLGGRGGGKDELAQGGGPNTEAVPAALAELARFVAERVE